VELEHLHVLERDPTPPDHGRSVSGERVRVGRDAEHPPVAARGEQHRLRTEDVQLSGGELVRDDPCGRSGVVPQQIQAVELVEEANVPLDALLVQRLQDHVPGAVRRVARALDRRLAVVAGVSAEPSLIDAPVRRSVEGKAPALQLVDRIDGFLGHQEGRRLIDEVVAALDRVERVPLGRVLLDVAQRRAHTPLCRSGVGPGRVQLGDDGRPASLRELDRRAQPGTAGADHQRVVRMGRGHPIGPHRVGSKVTTMTVPRTISVNPIT
jgi:hypothetical protein